MANPAWQDNYLACYPALLERLRGLQVIKSVQEAKEFSEVTAADNKMPPLDGAVYVVLDAFTPLAANDSGSEQDIQLGFSVILSKRNYTPQPSIGDEDVGATLTAICKAIQGFAPQTDDGRALTLTPFIAAKPLALMYRKGFAFFPLRFVTTVAVVSDN